jgi:hypothetical protein
MFQLWQKQAGAQDASVEGAFGLIPRKEAGFFAVIEVGRRVW